MGCASYLNHVSNKHAVDFHSEIFVARLYVFQHRFDAVEVPALVRLEQLV